ncbi:hypothetical protein AUJ67_02925 [Candidatus Desantisbacteria bacterium CG1_02_49_89]|nr:MAG: hypothetical protein AUJ67_02925 [Candidatus Desantisbacteria bacterium CG1_02_49_89]
MKRLFWVIILILFLTKICFAETVTIEDGYQGAKWSMSPEKVKRILIEKKIKLKEHQISKYQLPDGSYTKNDTSNLTVYYKDQIKGETIEIQFQFFKRKLWAAGIFYEDEFYTGYENTGAESFSQYILELLIEKYGEPYDDYASDLGFSKDKICLWYSDTTTMQFKKEVYIRNPDEKFNEGKCWISVTYNSKKLAYEKQKYEEKLKQQMDREQREEVKKKL